MEDAIAHTAHALALATDVKAHTEDATTHIASATADTHPFEYVLPV